MDLNSIKTELETIDSAENRLITLRSIYTEKDKNVIEQKRRILLLKKEDPRQYRKGTLKITWESKNLNMEK